MTVEFKRVLAELHEDHRNMAMLLDLLEREVAKLDAESDDAGEETDFELVHDIMRYMTVYSDAVHHPREDILYARMREEGPATAAGLDGVGPDHRDLAELGSRLRADIEAVIAGTALTRAQLLGDCRGYIERLRGHMRWEEEELFERAQPLADAGVALDDAHVSATDPVFGAEHVPSFTNLLERMREMGASAA